jgi:hypothetical protein
LPLDGFELDWLLAALELPEAELLLPDVVDDEVAAAVVEPLPELFVLALASDEGIGNIGFVCLIPML